MKQDGWTHRWIWRVGAVAAALTFAPSPAQADELIVQRHVTLRLKPSSYSAALAYPTPGSRLQLLDDGRRKSGYYHVRLPDGHVGWIYHTFVRRVPDTDTAEALMPPDQGPVAAVHYVDVDQGAAALLEFACGAVLIDAGGRGSAASQHLAEYLHTFFARRTDLNNRLSALFVTHAHFDHDMNLRRIADEFSVGGFIYNGATDPRITTMLARANQAQPAIPVMLIADQQFSAGAARGLSNSTIDPVNCAGVDPKIQVLSGGRASNPGWRTEEFNNPNNQSLVVRVDFGEASFLFTGDLETPAIGTLLARYAGTPLLDVDVFAVGHHGADNGTTGAMLAAMTPEVAVISVGQPDTAGMPMSAWDHGHPRKTMLQLLDTAIIRPRTPGVDVMAFDAQEGIPHPFRVTKAIYATSRDGDIVITAHQNGRLEVHTSH